MRTAAMPSLVPHLLATLGKDYDHTPDAGNDVGNDPQAVAPDAVLTVRTAPRRSTARLTHNFNFQEPRPRRAAPRPGSGVPIVSQVRAPRPPAALQSGPAGKPGSGHGTSSTATHKQ